MSEPPYSNRFPRDRPAMVSVIIPARNAAALLPAQLAALGRQHYEHDWELIVVDNGSTDDTADVAMSWSNRLPLRVVQAPNKSGVNHARNIGIHAAQGNLIAICDADDEVSDHWLTDIVEASLEADAVGGSIDTARLNSPIALLWNSALSDGVPTRPGGFLPTAIGCNFAVWTDVLYAIGGFDESYTTGADEVEFCWRLQLAGYRLRFSQQAIVHYRLRDDLGALARQFFNYGRGGARLHRDFRSDGMRHGGLREACKAWAWLFLHLPDLARSRPRRGNWVRAAAMRVGKAVGSIEHRTTYF